jgi:hypothetical protein
MGRDGCAIEELIATILVRVCDGGCGKSVMKK